MKAELNQVQGRVTCFMIVWKSETFVQINSKYFVVCCRRGKTVLGLLKKQEDLKHCWLDDCTRLELGDLWSLMFHGTDHPEILSVSMTLHQSPCLAVNSYSIPPLSILPQKLCYSVAQCYPPLFLLPSQLQASHCCCYSLVDILTKILSLNV